jgi:hypothetical protein
LSGYFDPSEDEIVLPFELGLLFSFQRPTLTTSNFEPRPPRPAFEAFRRLRTAEFIDNQLTVKKKTTELLLYFCATHTPS